MNTSDLFTTDNTAGLTSLELAKLNLDFEEWANENGILDDDYPDAADKFYNLFMNSKENIVRS